MTKILQIGKFSVKNAFRKKSIAILAIVGIAIGLSMQIIINAYNEGMNENFNEMLSDLAGTFDIQEKNRPSAFISQLPAETVDVILQSNYSQDIIGVTGEQRLPTTVGNLYKDVLGTTMLGRPMSLNIRGINLTEFLIVSSDLDTLIEGSRYFTEGADECIIPYEMWKNNTALFDIGNTLSLKINDTYYYNVTIVGVTEKAVGGLRQEVMQTGYDVFTSIEVTKKILNEILLPENHVYHYESHGYSSANISVDNFNLITVKTSLTDTDAIQSLAGSLVTLLEQEFPDMDFSSYSTAEALSSMSDFNSTLITIRTIISVVTVVAGGMGIIIAQLVGVDGRMKEFAILKATGWKEKHIILSVLIESMTLGLIGALISSVISAGVIAVLANAPIAIVDPVFTPALFITAFGISLTLGLLGGIYPGIRASTVNPIDILRSG